VVQGPEIILVADDEEIVRKTTRAALKSFGYTVLMAENGQVAVDLFRERATEIAAVILDMTMPVMGGEEAMRQIRALRPDARVILSSGYNEAEAVRQFGGNGMVAFIQKPYRVAKLGEVVRQVLES
jgi:CheY-like chemotaxis protein